MGRVLGRAILRAFTSLVLGGSLGLALIGCAGGSSDVPSIPLEVVDLEGRGIESEKALAICASWWDDLAVPTDFVAAIDSDIASIAELEEAVSYAADDWNVDNNPGDTYVAICVIEGRAAQIGGESDRIVMYFLEDTQANSIIFAYDVQ